jgi:Zn-dependent protease with chaperone function
MPAAAGPPPAKDAIPRVEQWKKDAFWNQDDLTKSWNLDRFSLEDERQLGQQLNALILQQNVQDHGPGLRRVKEVAKPLLDLVKPKEREYQFFVLDSDIPNAFSHPGGYVYVSRKLLEMIPEDQPALLEFVLGHEIAHVEAHHALACLNSPDVKKFSDGTLQKLYFLIIPYGYPDPFEYEADARAYSWMKQLRRTEHECRTFLRILDNYAKTHRFEHGRGKPEELLKEPVDGPKGEPVDGPKGDRTSTAIDNHLRSHPAAYDRLARLKTLSAAPHP